MNCPDPLRERAIAVFLDRDGVINEDRDDYVRSASQLKVFPDAPAAIRRLNEAGLRVFVVSNQQGVAKGLFTEQNLLDMRREIDRQVSAAGGEISDYYYCTHLDGTGCGCRKPDPGMLRLAADEHEIALDGSFMVGDSARDIAAGHAVGCRTILVLTGRLTRADADVMMPGPEFVAEGIGQAADYIIRAVTEVHRQ